MKKTISIAIATYNGKNYLRKQLDSLYNQELVPDEIVVSDDGSTDGTLEILKEYSDRYGLIYSINPGPHGVNNNFFRAISLCTKDYIAICDQDDIWLPNKLRVSYMKLQELDQGVPACVSSLCNHIDKDDRIIKERGDEKDTFGYAASLLTYGGGQDRSQGCSLMFNKQLADIVLDKVKGSPEILDYMLYDGFIAFSAAIVGVKYNLGKRLMMYRHHGSNVIAREGKRKPRIIDRIKSNDYFLFIPQARLNIIPKIVDIYSMDKKNEDAWILCKKISMISNQSSHFAAFKIIWSIHELSMIRRIEIILGTMSMDFTKLLFRL